GGSYPPSSGASSRSSLISHLWLAARGPADDRIVQQSGPPHSSRQDQQRVAVVQLVGHRFHSAFIDQLEIVHREHIHIAGNTLTGVDVPGFGSVAVPGFV